MDTREMEVELAHGMREVADGVSLTGDVLGAARLRDRRRRARRNTLLLTGVVGLAAVVTAALTLRPAPAEPVTAPYQQKLTVAYVSAQVRTALSANKVEHVRTTVAGSGEVSETWLDPETSSARFLQRDAAGNATNESSFSPTGITALDHVNHIWWTVTRDFNGRIGGLPMTPAEIGAAVSNGDDPFVIIGNEQLDGRATVHLRLTGSAASESKWGPGSELWVDATSFEVVRWTAQKPTDVSVLHIQYDFEWLDRTAENLAQLEVTAPTGYTHLEKPPSEPPAS